MDAYTLVLVGGGAIILLTAWLPMLLRHRPLSLPIFCVLFGAAVFSLPGIGLAPRPLERSGITEHLTELVVIVALMGAGLRIERPLGWRPWSITWRLLGITMPLTIVLIAVAGWAFIGLSASAAVLLAAALAPTDPVLASDVQVGPPRSGVEGDVRFGLTSEAGLNDGLAFPFVYLALAMAADGPAPGAWTWQWLGVDVLWRIGAGLVIGWLVGRSLSFLVFRLPDRTRLADTRDGFVSLGITLVSYGVTELAHGLGFLAVFVTALQLRRHERLHDYHERLHDFAEQTERLLMMILLVLFGGSIAGGLLAPLSWGGLFLVAFVLLVARPLTGWIGLLGGPKSLKERAVISFFGIRGIGTFYYLAFAANRQDWPEADTLWAIAGACVLTSVVLHGVTATPVMNRLDSTDSR